MPITPQQVCNWKQHDKPIVALTAWDYPLARLLDQAGVDLILVGDSLAMVGLGYANTLPLTLADMIHHGKAVRRGIQRALMVIDLPFMSYQESPQQALHSAGRIMKKTGAQAVKLEGGYPQLIDSVAKLVQVGIPVLGHIGLTPQAIHRLGYRQQGKTPEDSERLVTEAIALQQAGAFAVVLEHIPSELALRITQKLDIPTIGIGAGPDCDGQILVTADLLGLSDRQPPFAKVYVNLGDIATQAIQAYAHDVTTHQFPPASSSTSS